MDMFEACKKLCEIAVEDNNPEYSAYKLQFFYHAIEQGDTVAMAFAEVKNTWNKDYNSLVLEPEDKHDNINFE